jgi:two-component system, NtrC family, sensor kinase
VDSYILDMPLEKHRLDFNRLVNEASASFLEACKRQGIEFRASLAEELPKVEVDRRKTTEVLENLIENSMDAMPAGGKLTVSTRRENIEGQDFAVLEVTDTGEGIPEEKQSQIFEPFFTTKAVGKRQAVGLGLSISKKIMDLHGGSIEVESKAGEGSSFRLYFPL